MVSTGTKDFQGQNPQFQNPSKKRKARKLRERKRARVIQRVRKCRVSDPRRRVHNPHLRSHSQNFLLRRRRRLHFRLAHWDLVRPSLGIRLRLALVRPRLWPLPPRHCLAPLRRCRLQALLRLEQLRLHRP